MEIRDLSSPHYASGVVIIHCLRDLIERQLTNNKG